MITILKTSVYVYLTNLYHDQKYSDSTGLNIFFIRVDISGTLP